MQFKCPKCGKEMCMVKYDVEHDPKSRNSGNIVVYFRCVCGEAGKILTFLEFWSLYNLKL